MNVHKIYLLQTPTEHLVVQSLVAKMTYSQSILHHIVPDTMEQFDQHSEDRHTVVSTHWYMYMWQ